MAKNRSDKSPYLSRFGGGWVSGAQWLAENMCSRESRANFGGELPSRFWEDPFWGKKLKAQLKHANELLKEYEVSDVVQVLKHPDARRIYSLGLRSTLLPLLKKQKFKQSVQVKEQTIIDKVNVEEKPRKPFATRNSHLHKLRELDKG